LHACRSTLEDPLDPEKALAFKLGKSVSIDDVLISDTIFKDARKGLRASPEAMKEVFGTDDPRVVAAEIIKRGEIPLTAEQRRRLIEEKKAQIINLIAKNVVDPKTKLPIPVKRIELALEQAKVSIDPFKPAEQQFEEIITQLSKVIPIKVAKAYVVVKLPPEHSSRGLKALQSIGGTELEFVIMVIAVSCVKLLSAHNSTQHTSRKHKV
jgi:conserved hypothetical protein TIGR00291